MDIYRKRSAEFWAKAIQFVKNGTTDPKNPPWFELRLGERALWAWADYFIHHLGFTPSGLKKLDMGMCDCFFVPCESPDWFDTGYVLPSHIQRWPPPDDVPIAKPGLPPRAGDFANVLVLREAPNYAAMVARSEHAPRREWCHDDRGRGIWVSRFWIDDDLGRKARWQPLTMSQLNAIAAANREYERAPEPIQEAAE